MSPREVKGKGSEGLCFQFPFEFYSQRTCLRVLLALFIHVQLAPITFFHHFHPPLPLDIPLIL